MCWLVFENEFSCLSMNFHVSRELFEFVKRVFTRGAPKNYGPLVPMLFSHVVSQNPWFLEDLGAVGAVVFFCWFNHQLLLVFRISFSSESSFSSAGFGMGFFSKNALLSAVIESMYSCRLGLIGQQTQRRFFSVLWLCRSIMTIKK